MYSFRLEKVLRHRTRHLEHCSREMKKAADLLNDLGRRRAELSAFIASITTQAARERQRQANVALWRRQTDYLGSLQQKLMSVRQREQRAAEELTARRAELLQAHQECQVLEKLKARQQLAWQQRQSLIERKQMDEIGSRRR